MNDKGTWIIVRHLEGVPLEGRVRLDPETSSDSASLIFLCPHTFFLKVFEFQKFDFAYAYSLEITLSHNYKN